MSDIYLKQHLLNALKKAGLPCSYPTLVRYEVKGIIPKTGRVTSKHRKWRVYTQDDIDAIVEAVRKYKK